VREEGGGGVILAIKIWKFREVGGAYVKFPPWGGAHIFWKAHILDTLRNRPTAIEHLPRKIKVLCCVV